MRKRNEKLEKDFQEALGSDYEIWKERRAKGDRSGVRFRGMLTRLGGVTLAHRLLASQKNQSTVLSSLWEDHKITLEWEVTRRRFRSLFNDAEITQAKDRLQSMRPNSN